MLAQQSPKLSVAAKEFIPTFALENNALPPKKKKTKEEKDSDDDSDNNYGYNRYG